MTVTAKNQSFTYTDLSGETVEAFGYILVPEGTRGAVALREVAQSVSSDVARTPDSAGNIIEAKGAFATSASEYISVDGTRKASV